MKNLCLCCLICFFFPVALCLAFCFLPFFFTNLLSPLLFLSLFDLRAVLAVGEGGPLLCDAGLRCWFAMLEFFIRGIHMGRRIVHTPYRVRGGHVWSENTG